MAVKQNNTENNSNHAAKKQRNSKQNSKQTKNENQVESSNIRQQKNLNMGNDTNLENVLSATETSVNIEMILQYFDILHKKQSEANFKEILSCCIDLLRNMAELPEPHTADEIKRFKENIERIGDLLRNIALYDPQLTNAFYFHYLKAVCDLIATDGFDPCYAISIVFQFFPDDFIVKAAILPLKTYGNDDKIIKKSVRILCDWLRKCTFCSNLNLWILAILYELKNDVNKHNLLKETSLIIIEPLTIALIIPILRPKVYPIVFQILSFFKDTPVVFHKIVGRMPLVLKQLKKECETQIDNQEETKKIFHDLVDLMSALIKTFPKDEHLYLQLNENISQCQKSYEYTSALIGGDASYITDTHIDHNNVEITDNPKVGLVNLGNTCYMNSVLQALLMTKDFCREVLLFKARSPVLLKIQQFFALLMHSTRPELTPSVILQVARPPGFAPGFQQDSSEFLGFFLETIHELECRSVKVAQQSLEKLKEKRQILKQNFAEGDNENVTENMLKDIDEMDENQTLNFQKSFDENQDLFMTMDVDEAAICDGNQEDIKSNDTKDVPIQTTIDRIFTGKLATTYKCLECDFESKNVDTFRELQLSFPDQNKQVTDTELASNSLGTTNCYSVQDLLDFYCTTEKLQGDNQYFCEKCEKLCDAERSLNCVLPPTNLILTLKQFKYDQKFNMRAKLMHRIHHNENLLVNVFSEKDNCKLETINYCLYAAVVHTGFNMDSGHYYTYGRDLTKSDSQTSMWFKFNDNYVTECSDTELQNMDSPNTPYILFYRMKLRKNLDGFITEIKPATPPYLEELPSILRNFIDDDNDEHKAEKERYAQPNKIRLILRSSNSNNTNKKDDNEDNEDGDGTGSSGNPPPNCGGNALENDYNNFIY